MFRHEHVNIVHHRPTDKKITAWSGIVIFSLVPGAGIEPARDV
ncbi:hypothetical protein [Neisseria meningitidis serogroup B]|uniref:Uncharacterized protein n=1 Tax=Neisseria meningitidis serogroup B TaxID=491 RepID=A0A0H5QT31_NEIMI|nr:hypothetical protein [Neisseria meningitidis serogroup B]